MKITTVCQNVQGLNDPLKLDIVRQYYRSLFASIEVLCLQEHHLRGERLLALQSSFWPQAQFYGVDAEPGFGNTPQEVGAGTGGVCMWVSPRVAHLVTASRQSQDGRGQWIRMGGLAGGDVSILNVYASTSVRERSFLWEELREELPKDCCWIICGDWNFVEHIRDKSNLNGRVITTGESRVFSLLKDALNVGENFRSSNGVRFTWDNRRVGAARSLARLDRFYTFAHAGAGLDPVIDCHIKGDCYHADHLPVLCSVLLQPIPKRTSTYKMSSLHLKDPVVVA